MDFKINTVHFTADEKLVEFIREKVSKLEMMYDQIISSEVYLRLDKSDTNENKIAEVKVHIPGNPLFLLGRVDPSGGYGAPQARQESSGGGRRREEDAGGTRQRGGNFSCFGSR